MKSKIGLVMTGGGARAAYQVGVARALYEIAKHKDKLFDVISGNSAGAINSTFLAANADNWDLGTKRLIELWKGLETQYVFDLRAKTISELGFKWMAGSVLGGLKSKKSETNYLLDTKPLKKLLEKEIDFLRIQKNIDAGHIYGLSLSATNYNSGSNVIFFDGDKNIEDWARSDRFSYREHLKIEHVMASAAIPFFFPPVQVGQSFFGDGCIRQTTPLSPAIHLGADKIIAIGVRYPHDKNKMMEHAFSPFGNPTLGQVAGVMLNAIFLDSLEADVERLGRTNSHVRETKYTGLKEIPIFMIRPSKDLGKLTARLSQELPPMLRYLLKGIGVSDKEGLDLLSYLAFDESYTMPLIELGYEDTLKMREELLQFIDA
jgi:NTE family protein